MKHIILTVSVCLEVAAFTAIYFRATEVMTRAIAEGLSQVSVSTERSFAGNLIRPSLDACVHNFTVRRLR